MGIFKLFKKAGSPSEQTIRVEFVNAADNAVIAISDMPPRQLPDSFAIETTLDIKNQKWSVQSADPAEKAEFLKTGRLRLMLSRLTLVNPADILFSLPTISDDIGNAVGDTRPSDGILSIHEDDWRQIEFISNAFISQIDEEFADIRRIWSSERSGLGFKKVHVRKRIPEPLTNASFSLKDLSTIVPPQKRYEAVGFLKKTGTIPQSFAWAVCGNFVMWGITDTQGRILRLCVSDFPPPDNAAAMSAAFGTLAERYHLHLVNWCQAACVSKTAAFQNYFSQQT